MQKKLQVFVSSTYNDLIVERQASVEAILRAGHIPAGMELFAAGSESQLEIIKRWIDSSDIYMLLLGGRYGSIEPNSGLSYTEIEYRYAVEQNKPLFAVILSDSYIQQKVKEYGTTIIELAERGKLDLFSVLVKGKISRYANNQGEIRLSVLESMLDIQTRYSLKGWVREDQLPDVAELINQIKDLKSENLELKTQIKVSESTDYDTIGDYQFDDVKNALKKIPVSIPQVISNIDPFESNAYELFIAFQRRLSAGINNKMGASDLYSFLYFNLCPYLRIYELTDIVKVPNVQWTIFQTTKLGNRFLSIANMKDESPTLQISNNSISRIETQE
jgi:hypothetical protein